MKEELYCSRCFAATYCSRICQKSHWSFHKIECGKYPSIAVANKYIDDILNEWDFLRAVIDVAVLFNRKKSGYIKCKFDNEPTFITNKITHHTGTAKFKLYTNRNINHKKLSGHVTIEIHYAVNKENYVRTYFAPIGKVNKPIEKYFAQCLNDINVPIYFELTNDGENRDTTLIPCDLSSMSELD